MVIEKISAQNTIPTSLFSLTPNDTCVPIAQHPAQYATIVRSGLIGVVLNDQPIFCGGHVGSLQGTRECWKYNKVSDSWILFPSMVQKRYAHGVHVITPEIFMFTGMFISIDHNLK